MKKKAPIVFIIVSVFAVAAIIIISAYRSSESYRKAKATIQWDCSVSCTEKSTSAQYVITYSNVKVSSKTGTLTIQNRCLAKADRTAVFFFIGFDASEQKHIEA